MRSVLSKFNGKNAAEDCEKVCFVFHAHTSQTICNESGDNFTNGSPGFAVLETGDRGAIMVILSWVGNGDSCSFGRLGFLPGDHIRDETLLRFRSPVHFSLFLQSSIHPGGRLSSLLFLALLLFGGSRPQGLHWWFFW